MQKPLLKSCRFLDQLKSAGRRAPMALVAVLRNLWGRIAELSNEAVLARLFWGAPSLAIAGVRQESMAEGRN